jgi:uncharacterized membrane protein
MKGSSHSLLKAAVNKLIPFRIRQAHHERNQQLTIRPEFAEGLPQNFLKVIPSSLPVSPYAALLIASAFYFLAMLLFGLDRHWSFKTSINDTGVFDHAIWSYIQEGVFVDTINLSRPINWLGFHFNPILFLFVPLYWLYPAPEWLIFAQALAIASTAWPLYKSARHLRYSEGHALLWSLGFLLNPFVISAAMWDFHPVAIATPFIAWSIYYLLAKVFKKLLLAAFIVLLCQEQFGILILCMGLSYYALHREFKKSVCLAGLGVLYTAFVFYYAFPKLSPTGTHLMMSQEMAGLSRYSWLGRTLFEIVSHFFSRPLDVLKTVIIDMEAYRYIILLLLPYGFILPLLGFEILVIGTADFAANSLSLNPLPRGINGYHSITLIPVVIIAAMVGFKRGGRIFPEKLCNRTGFLTLFAFLMLYAMSLPHLFGKNSLWMLSLIPAKNSEWAEVQNRIPAHAVVSAQANIGPHLSQRKTIYTYPNKLSEAEYAVLKLEDADDSLKMDTFRFNLHFIMDPEEYLASIKCLIAAGTHQITYFKAPWLVLLRTSGTAADTQLPLLTGYMETLERRWKIDKIKMNKYPCKGQ